jgi:hypothetical protein
MLLALFLMTILPQTLFAFVRCNLMSFTFTAAGHNYLCFLLRLPK